MSIKERLRLFPIIAIVLSAIAVVVYFYFNGVREEKSKISADCKVTVEHLLKGRITVYQFLRDPKEEKAQAVREAFGLLGKELSDLKSELKVAENQERVAACEKLNSEYVAKFNELAKGRIFDAANGVAEESASFKDDIKSMAAMGKDLEAKILEVDRVALELRDEVRSEMKVALLALFAALALVPLVLSTKISSSVLETIAHLKNGFEVINNSHDTNHRLQVEGSNELGEVANLFNQYMDKLADIANKDQEVIKDISRVTKMMECGFVSVRVKPDAGSPALQAVRNEFNHALEEMEISINEVSKVMSEFGNSNFSVNIDTGKYSGEIGGMTTALKGLGEALGDFMALLSRNGSALNSGASTLSSASGNLSESSNTQASSLEETAAAIEELTSNISANSQKATQMATLAQEAQKAATDGKSLADSTVLAMNEISSATQAINEAVDIIDNIAFQTNILSLNAAVEAATAGEAGKGFAVVAQEVRNLAGRSAEAAKQIKELAELANSKSSGGLRVSEDMMKGFDVINQKIAHTTQLVQDVANGSREQMAGINQINTAVAQLDQMTQQNAGSANEVNKLAEDILSMAQNLSDTAAKTKYTPASNSRICKIDMMFETNKLKFDHVNFKNNNFGKVKDSVSAWTVVNETQCDLGKWIAAHSNEAYARTPEWSALMTHHGHVHQKVQEYINREKAGASPEELCRISKEIEADTTQVFAGLNNLRTVACEQDAQLNQAMSAHAPKAHMAVARAKSAPVKHSDDDWDSF